MQTTGETNTYMATQLNAVLNTNLNTLRISAAATGAAIAISGAGAVLPLTFDKNGNMTSDGINSYVWDAMNRLIQINYPGSGNNSQFTYDAMSGLVKIVETASASVTSTKQFVRCGFQICEERDASSAITKQFFYWGQTISGTNYYYFRNHLGSITDVFTADGTVVAHYEYGPFGQVTATGSLASDFQYAGMYYHAPSGLNLAVQRAYSPSLGRWINRDPIGEDGGLNLYRYGFNRPTTVIDPTGLTPLTTQQVADAFGIPTNFPGGCFDVINGATGNTPGTKPDNLQSTLCWYGPDAQAAAKDYAKKCCGTVWSKNGQWTAGSPPVGGPGPIDPSYVASRPVDYVTLNPNGKYYDLNGAGPNAGGNVYNSAPGGYPAVIWCATCRGKQGLDIPAKPAGYSEVTRPPKTIAFGHLPRGMFDSLEMRIG